MTARSRARPGSREGPSSTGGTGERLTSTGSGGGRVGVAAVRSVTPTHDACHKAPTPISWGCTSETGAWQRTPATGAAPPGWTGRGGADGSCDPMGSGGGLRGGGQPRGRRGGPGAGAEAAVFEEPGAGSGEGHDRVGGAVAELVQGLGAEVVDGVTGLVVAGVVGLAGGAAVDGGLLGGLLALGAAEEASGGDADGDERAVVGAAVEGGRLGGQALAGEVLVEDVLDLGRARRAGRGGVGPVAVVDEADVVRRAEH